MRPLVWIGWFRHGSLSPGTREYFKALIPQVETIKAAPLEVLPESDFFSPFIKEIEDDDFLLLHHLPTTEPDANGFFTVFEYNHLPTQWIEILQNAECILTQSRFCQNLFEKDVPTKPPVILAPYILTQEYLNFQQEGNKLEFYHPDIFDFGSIFEWVARKVPELMIKAFLEEFQKTEPVRLVLKTEPPSLENLSIILRDSGINLEQFERAIQKQRIIIYSNFIEQLPDFYRSINSYISATAGEGWGQTLTEAMASGLPTIGSKHSGPLDFMTSENSYLCEVEDWSSVHLYPTVKLLHRAYDLEFPEEENFQWKLPQLDSIKNQMRKVYSIWQQDPHRPRSSWKHYPSAMQICASLNAQKLGKSVAEKLGKFL